MSGSRRAAAVVSSLVLFAGGAGCGHVTNGSASSDAAGAASIGGKPVAAGGALSSAGQAPVQTSGGSVVVGAGANASGAMSAGLGEGGTTDDEAPAAGSAGASAEPPIMREPGPCDVYAEAGTACVAAYSTVRRLRRDYVGPLYQVRTGSNAMNTGMGGELHDIGSTEAGFADAQAQDAICAESTCTIARLYDQSGQGNDLRVAPAGSAVGGEFASSPDFEAIADAGPLRVGNHPVYSLFMQPRAGYRSSGKGNGIPRGASGQGVYMLADGTRVGTGCCWTFGNAASNPATFSNDAALMLGGRPWAVGDGDGPWFMFYTAPGVWAGGSKAGDPGWGGFNGTLVPNPANPSLAVPFALGFLKLTKDQYVLRMADVGKANGISTAYRGALFLASSLGGGVILGIGRYNENNSFGTFYEGAILADSPSDEVEEAVLRNVQHAGYGKADP